MHNAVLGLQQTLTALVIMPSWLTCCLIQGEATGVEQGACTPAADVNSKKASKKKRKKCGVPGSNAVEAGQLHGRSAVWSLLL